MKHAAIDSNFVRDQVEKNQIKVSHISTATQLADALTKTLPRRAFTDFVDKIGLRPVKPVLRGMIRIRIILNFSSKSKLKSDIANKFYLYHHRVIVVLHSYIYCNSLTIY